MFFYAKIKWGQVATDRSFTPLHWWRDFAIFCGNVRTLVGKPLDPVMLPPKLIVSLHLTWMGPNLSIRFGPGKGAKMWWKFTVTIHHQKITISLCSFSSFHNVNHHHKICQISALCAFKEWLHNLEFIRHTIWQKSTCYHDFDYLKFSLDYISTDLRKLD